MESHREKLIQGLNFRKDEYFKLFKKYVNSLGVSKKQRCEIMYKTYGLFLDCLEHPDKTKVVDVDNFIIASKNDLKEEDLEELRKVRKLVLNSK